MTESRGPQEKCTHSFRASRGWIFNVRAAALAGLGGCILMQVMFGIVLWLSPHFGHVLLRIAGLELLLAAGLLVAWPGNMIAAYPYEVVIEEGKGLQLYAAMKQVFIPTADIRDVQKSFLEGYVVRLNRRHHLLKKFVIHRLFGGEAEALARAIQEEARRIAARG